MKSRKIFVEAISILLIVLWVYAGMSKIMEFETFKYQLGRSPYLENISGLIAIGLPLMEIAIAVCLIFKRTRMLGLYLSFFLMILFTAYIFTMLNFSYYIPCSCGGIMSKLSWDEHLIFNLIITILCFIGVLLKGKLNKFDSKSNLVSNSQ